MFFKRLENEFALQRKYIGHGNAIRRFRKSIVYAEQEVLTSEEQVLASIAVSAAPEFHKQMHGLLIATNMRLLFVTSSRHYGDFFEVLPYYAIERVTMRRHRKTEIILRFRRMDKCYVAAYIDERLSTFRQAVRQQIENSKDESHIS